MLVCLLFELTSVGMTTSGKATIAGTLHVSCMRRYAREPSSNALFTMLTPIVPIIVKTPTTTKVSNEFITDCVSV